jgi:protein involved in polysaccharide export with SLBB domain
MIRLILVAVVFLFEGIAQGQSDSIIGEVQHPGTYPLSNGTSVIQALLAAGGPTRFASPANTSVIRDNREIHVNLRNVLNGKAPDIPLMDGDKVRIPMVDPNQPRMRKKEWQLINPGIFVGMLFANYEAPLR